jgi:hypothetical protein
MRVVLIAMWSAALASTTTTLLRSLETGATVRPGAAALGALAGGILALAPAVLSSRRNPSGSTDAAAGLA